jgi:hypothetical protein
MTNGSIAVPGAIIFINNDLASSTMSRIVSQLQIEETITFEELNSRLIADPNYTRNIRIERRRIMVTIDFLTTDTRTQADVVVYVKNGLVSISKSCFGPPGATYPFNYLYWGQLCIFDTDLDRTCANCGLWWRQCGCNDGYGHCCNMTYATFFGHNHSYGPARFPYASGAVMREGEYRFNHPPRGPDYTYDCNGTVVIPIDCPLTKCCK